MKCNKIKEMIPLYLCGLLSENEKLEFEKHLSQCQHCQKELDLEKQIEKDLNNLFNDEYQEVSPIFEKKLIKNKNTGLYFKTALAIAATILIATILFFFKPDKGISIVEPQIETAKIITPEVQSIVFVNEKLETKVNKLGDNVYLVQIQGGQND